MEEQTCREVRDEKTLKVIGGVVTVDADKDVELPEQSGLIATGGWATAMPSARTQRPNFGVLKLRLNPRGVASLSLLLLLSVASARVLFEDHGRDGPESQFVISEPTKDENIAGKRVKPLGIWEKALFIFPKGPLAPHSGPSSDAFREQEFGRDTNRLDYFRVTALDVPGDNNGDNNNLTGNASYGDGGGGSNTGVGAGPILEQGIVNTSTSAGGGDRPSQVLVRISANNGGDGGEVIAQRLDHESCSNGGEVVAQGSEEETHGGWCGVGDSGDGGGFVEVEWWEEWWMWLALWKLV